MKAKIVYTPSASTRPAFSWVDIGVFFRKVNPTDPAAPGVYVKINYRFALSLHSGIVCDFEADERVVLLDVEVHAKDRQ